MSEISAGIKTGRYHQGTLRWVSAQGTGQRAGSVANVKPCRWRRPACLDTPPRPGQQGIPPATSTPLSSRLQGQPLQLV